MKLRIQLDDTFEIDLNELDLEQMNEEQLKDFLINQYVKEIGLGEINLYNVSTPILSISEEVQANITARYIKFYQDEFERELTDREKTAIRNWIINGQLGKLVI